MLKKLTILCLFVAVYCYSQEDRTIFQGLIYDDLGVLPNAHIVNLQTKKATSSLNQGEFEVFAKVGDSLKITSVGYKTKILKLKIQHFGIQTTKIHLKKDIIELDEVVVGNNNLLGILESDVKSVKKQQKIDAKSLKLPNAGKRILTPAERKIYTATTSMGGISVDLIINTLSGRLKKLKKLKEFEDTEKEIMWLKNNFKHYIINDLKILKDDFYRFLYYCKSDKNYYKFKMNRINFLIFIEEKSKEFKGIN